MIKRTLFLVVLSLMYPFVSLADQARTPIKVAEQDAQKTAEEEQMIVVLEGNDPESAAGVRKPMQDIKNVGQANQVDDERFQVKEEFGQTQQQQRVRWMAPESISDRSRMKQSEVEQAEGDVDAVVAEQTRKGGDDDGRTDKSDVARTMAPCPAGNIAAQSAAASAAGATPADPAAAATNCTN